MQKKDELTLTQWLDYLEKRYVDEIQLGLTRVQTVAKAMQLLNPSAKVITVAGTNGKGSTIAALEAIYHAAGYRVGAYTSPHLLKFNERICVNKQPITDEMLCLAFSIIEKNRQEYTLTYFEVVTLAALWYYDEQNVDVILLEVGLGGRLDATNIIDSDLAIITTIDFDHQSYLGNTLDAIGYEKAGILRPGKPCVYADLSPPLSILAEIKKNKSPFFSLAKDYQITDEKDNFVVQFLDKRLRFAKPNIHLKEAAAALVASECLQSVLPVNFDAQVQAMQTVSVPGRLDLHLGEINVLYDVSHNPQAANRLAEYLQDYNCVGKIHAVFSALADKDIRGLIIPLRDCVDHWYPAQLNNKRASTRQVLAAAFNDLNVNIKKVYSDPLTAFLKAKTEAKPKDLIMVYGSFYTVSAILDKEI